ncbi:MAG: T9SS type A sorting domain-containing protein [Salibacteraceae bacterium]
MKKLLLLSAVFIMSLGATAQLSFDQDTASLTMEANVSHKAEILVSNTGNHKVKIRWSLISSTLNDDWGLQFCECNNCYTNDFGPLPTSGACADSMDIGESLKWYLTVNPYNEPMEKGEWIIKVTNVTDNISDTLYYYAKNPLSVNNISANANVTSFPNPANDELVINYELTNVSKPQLTIYSIVGEEIATYQLNNIGGVLRLNTQELKNGMYFYSIKENNTRVFTQKFNIVH